MNRQRCVQGTRLVASQTYDDAAVEVELQRRADHACRGIWVVGPGRRHGAGPPREEGRELVSAVRAHAHALRTTGS